LEKFADECEERNKETKLYMKKTRRFIKKINKHVLKIVRGGKLTFSYKPYYIYTRFTSYKRAIFYFAEIDKQPRKDYWKRLKSQIICEAERPFRREIILKHLLQKWPRL